MEDREAQIIRRIYFNGCSWNHIAEEISIVRRKSKEK